MAQTSGKKFEIEGNRLVKYNGNESIVYIPDKVAHIMPNAFKGCKELERVETPVALATIGSGAFYDCPALKEVIMPGFLFNRINCADIFDDPKKIYFRFYASSDGDAVYDETIFERDMPATITVPAGNAAEKESVTENIPSSAKVVNVQQAQTTDVVERVVREDIQPVEVINNVAVVISEEQDSGDYDEEEVSYADNVTVIENLDEMESRTLQQKIEAVVPVEVIKDITPAVQKHEYKEYADFIIEGSEVIKYIGTGESAEVPEFITVIGEKAFSNSAIKQVSLPEGLLNISDGAFNWCENLQTITLPQTLKIIGEEAFANCSSLEEAIIPDNVKFIGAGAFHACSSLKKLSLPENVSIGRRAFDFCVALKEAQVPEGITILSEGAFSHCEGLKKVTLPETLTAISSWAFAECYSLEDINFPQTLNTIGDVAFMNCRSLKELSLPHSLIRLGRQCFVGCEGFTAVFIPAHLQGQIKPLKVFNRLKNIQVHFVDLE
jgi:hypothetical protein